MGPHPVGRVFVRATDGAGPLVLFLHGYPSSSYDFRAVLELPDLGHYPQIEDPQAFTAATVTLLDT